MANDKPNIQPMVDILKRKIIEHASWRVDGLDTFAAYRAEGDSPIERALHTAVYAYAYWASCCQWRLMYVDVDFADPEGKERFFFPIRQQVPLPDLDWRVDFVFSAWNFGSGGWKHLIVECDGHNFHERDKEQARRDRSRDRLAIERGYTVYRFTGSEIWNDGFACAAQIFRWTRQWGCEG